MDAKEIKGGASADASPLAQQKDVDLIKKTFKGQGDLLLQIRSLLFGIELLPDEVAQIRSVFADEQLLNLFYRRFLPDIKNSRYLALGQIQDIWLGTEQMMFGAPAMQIEQAYRYKDLAKEYTTMGLMLLVDPMGPKVPYKVSSHEEDPMQINLLARNMYLKHIDQQLMMLNLIAHQEVETPKEKEERHLRNSAK